MAAIKSIKVGETVYDIKATYDKQGNVIDETFAKIENIPTKTSQLTNDSNYLTEHQDISGLATKEELNGKVDKVENSGLVPDSKILAYDNHLSNTSNPHSVTKAQLGLENVNNTSDADKPISTATQEALDNKVDKESGKQLSTEDYSTAEKEKLAGIADNANNYTHPSTHEASIITQDDTHRFVSDTEKATWNNKAETTIATDSSNGLMSNSDKSKLDGIEANANNYTHPTTSGNKHVPTDGSDGQLLSYLEDGTAQWSDSTSKLDSRFTELNQKIAELKSNIELNRDIDLHSYGVEWDITVSSPILTRIGNPLLHKSLPIQSAYRGCVANNGVVNYYLYPDDWAYKEDGITPSVLDGTDGTVRVHTPKFYGKSGSNGNKRWVRISLVKLDDSWIEIPELLIDAYRNTVDTTVSETPKAVSVVNTTEAFRGGSNRAQFDEYLTTDLDNKDAFRSDLGKPRTNISRADMRTYATNADSELLCYEYYKWIFYWNYVIEYANFNSQATYNAELTSDGYRQGGLGDGITNMSNWREYNSNNPLTPCGFGNSIGNFTGIKDLIIPTFQYVVDSNQFNAWTNNTSTIIASNSSDNSKLITQVKGTDNYAFSTDANKVWGSVIYNISGLVDGQKVIFKEKRNNSDYTTSETILEVDSDGAFTVIWSDYNIGSTKYVGFSIEQESCNIKIYNTNINQYTLQRSPQTLKMARWRGFDNPFGDIYTNLDGVVIQRTVANEISSVYTTTDKEEFTDVTGNKTIAGYEVAQDGYIKEFDLGETAEIIPSSCTGASPTTYMGDCHWCNSPSIALRTLLVGGNADVSSHAGLSCFYSRDDVSSVSSTVGFRTLNRVSKI